MRVTIRLYKRYDIDLLSLYHNSQFPFKVYFKSAIRNYIRGTPEKIKIPEPQDDQFSYETIQFQLNFHPEEDQDVIQWIRNIKAGYKNSILKNIFRNSLCGIYYYYTMNVHHAEEMKQLNQQIVNVKDDLKKSEDKKQQFIQEGSTKEDIDVKESINEAKNVFDNLSKKESIKKDEDTSGIEKVEERIEPIVETKITIPIRNDKADESVAIENDTFPLEAEDEENNELNDIDDTSYDDENSIFDIAGKMMQGF